MNVYESSKRSESISSVPKKSGERDFHAAHRRLIRREELEILIPFFEPGCRILEIGAGAGWQAKELSRRGFKVHAIDLSSSNYSSLREWPVIDYDGHTIPLPDDSVDVVFSSNVLEHVPHVKEFQLEIKRVLVPGGVAVHVLPTSTWRTWTSLTFFVRRILRIRRESSGEAATFVRKRVGNILFPPRHGVRGSFLTESYFFSEFYWRRLFRETGWNIEAVLPNELLYSGNRIFGARLSVRNRRWLSSFLGSSCKIYVLRDAQSSTEALFSADCTNGEHRSGLYRVK